MSCSWHRKIIQHRIPFCWWLWDMDIHIAPATPVLSEWKIMWEEQISVAMIAHKLSSTATISAHPMSQSSIFHPSINSQANHFPSIMNPIPQDVEVSMKISEGCGVGAHMIFIPHQSAERWDFHQEMSSKKGFVILWCERMLCVLTLKPAWKW